MNSGGQGVPFTEFVSSRQRSLLRFAMVLTGDARLAEEIVADVLARCGPIPVGVTAFGTRH